MSLNQQEVQEIFQKDKELLKLIVSDFMEQNHIRTAGIHSTKTLATLLLSSAKIGAGQINIVRTYSHQLHVATVSKVASAKVRSWTKDIANFAQDVLHANGLMPTAEELEDMSNYSARHLVEKLIEKYDITKLQMEQNDDGFTVNIQCRQGNGIESDKAVDAYLHKCKSVLRGMGLKQINLRTNIENYTVQHYHTDFEPALSAG